MLLSISFWDLLFAWISIFFERRRWIASDRSEQEGIRARPDNSASRPRITIGYRLVRAQLIEIRSLNAPRDPGVALSDGSLFAACALHEGHIVDRRARCGGVTAIAGRRSSTGVDRSAGLRRRLLSRSSDCIAARW